MNEQNEARSKLPANNRTETEVRLDQIEKEIAALRKMSRPKYDGPIDKIITSHTLVPAHASFKLSVGPDYTPYFMPGAVRMRAFDLRGEPSRIRICSASIGGAPNMLGFDGHDAPDEHSKFVWSDSFEAVYPIPVSWAVIGALGVYELLVSGFNSHPTPIDFSIEVYGQPVHHMLPKGLPPTRNWGP